MNTAALMGVTLIGAAMFAVGGLWNMLVVGGDKSHWSVRLGSVGFWVTAWAGVCLIVVSLWP